MGKHVTEGIGDILGPSLGDTSLMSLCWPEFTVGVFFICLVVSPSVPGELSDLC